MIKLEDFKELNTLPFYHDNDFIGNLNDFQVLQLCLYIVKNNIENVYCISEDGKHFIDLMGNFDKYPKEYMQTQKVFADLFNLRKQKRNEQK